MLGPSLSPVSRPSNLPLARMAKWLVTAWPLTSTRTLDGFAPGASTIWVNASPAETRSGRVERTLIWTRSRAGMRLVADAGSPMVAAASASAPAITAAVTSPRLCTILPLRGKLAPARGRWRGTVRPRTSERLGSCEHSLQRSRRQALKAIQEPRLDAHRNEAQVLLHRGDDRLGDQVGRMAVAKQPDGPL